jgi:MFS transporter, SP family, general alpha glucoside:H+ symporter
MLIAVASTFSRISIMDQSSFRVIFAGGWAFPAALAAGLYFMPESPYWLVMKSHHDKARKSLVRLSNGREDIEARLVQIQHTIEAERRLNAQKTSWAELFRGTNLRRTRIIVICFYMPVVVGSVIASNAPYFLNQTGLDSHTVVKLVQIGISLGVVSALFNIFLMMHIRHRLLTFIGVAFCAAMFLIMGVMGTMARTETNMTIIGMALLITSLSYGPAVGASNAIAGETSATQLRSKSMGLGQGWSAISSTIWQIILPYLFNADQLNLGGNIGWIFFVQAVLYLALLYFDVPGTKGRTYEELDIMFEQRIPAWRFESHKIDGNEQLD